LALFAKATRTFSSESTGMPDATTESKATHGSARLRRNAPTSGRSAVRRSMVGNNPCVDSTSGMTSRQCSKSNSAAATSSLRLAASKDPGKSRSVALAITGGLQNVTPGRPSEALSTKSPAASCADARA